MWYLVSRLWAAIIFGMIGVYLLSIFLSNIEGVPLRYIWMWRIITLVFGALFFALGLVIAFLVFFP